MVAAPRIVSRYALFDEIAAGGMATVHLGRLLGPVGFARTVAIKRLHGQFAKDPEFVDMFIDEARLAARIQHPNVVQTLDVVMEDGELLLVMDYVHGQPLSALLRLAQRKNQRVPPAIAAAIVASALDGLHAAHEASDERGRPLGLVHRDVSPHNLMVSVDGATRVLDFGVAKAIGRLQTTATGQLKGKVPYMSPEQIAGGLVDRRSDLWAAGVVLWETLVGRRMFEAANDAQVIGQILSATKPELPSQIDVSVPATFDRVIERALARDPSDRFATAREMARAVEACIGVAPPSEVSAWVKSIAAEALEKREKIVAEVESTANLRLSPETLRAAAGTEALGMGATPPVTRERRGLLPLMVLLGLVMFGAIALVVFRSPTTTQLPRSTTTPASMAPTHATAAASVAPPETASPAPLPTAPPTALPLPPDKPKTPTIKPKSTAQSNCDPPYTIDAKGHKQYKIHCL